MTVEKVTTRTGQRYPSRRRLDGLGSRTTSTEIDADRTGLAVRCRAAVRLSEGNEQRVEFVEERGIGRQVSFDEGARLLVTGLAPGETMSSQNPPRIGIGDEDGPAGRVEQNGVDRLRAEPGYAQQLAAQRGQRLAAQPLPAASEPFEQPHREVVNALRLEPIGPRRADHRREVADLDRDEPPRVEPST